MRNNILTIFWCYTIISIFPSILSCPNITGCQINDQKNILYCNGKIDAGYFNLTHVQTVYLCNYNNNTLNLNTIVTAVRNVENIVIFKCNATYIVGPYDTNKIKTITINNSTVSRLNRNFITHLRKLELLDLRHNLLQGVYLNKDIAKNLTQIYLTDNKWNCSMNLDWVLKLNKTNIRDNDKLKCFGRMYSEKNIFYVAKLLRDSQINCPRECHCTLPLISKDFFTEALTPVIEVNCTDRGLEKLPSKLPTFTKILHAERNAIEDLDPLIKNPMYNTVVDLFLDHNLVESIDNLEGAPWLANFRVLSLNGNKLTQLPTYALDNALKQNQNFPEGLTIYLGGNPWRCDCVFIPGFQEMLMKYQPQIKDVDDVTCSYVQGDDNSMSPIVGLSRASVCRLPTEYSIQALDLLNIVLASLIVLVLGKLAYDYYYFKRTGRLPWIVTKMP